MAVFKPTNRTTTSINNRNTTENITNINSVDNNITNNTTSCNCECNNQNYEQDYNQNYEQDYNQGYNQCECPHPHPHPHPIEPVITISVDEGPAILEPDVVYGPPGKDGTINGYNEVEILGGKNIKVNTCDNKITINSGTFINKIEAFKQNDCNCGDDCDCPCHDDEIIWYIAHDLHKRPSVTVVDKNYRVIECEIQYISDDKVKLLFNQEFEGWAYLN